MNVGDRLDISSVGDPDRRIRMFLGLLDPEPDPLIRGTDPASDPGSGSFPFLIKMLSRLKYGTGNASKIKILHKILA